MDTGQQLHACRYLCATRRIGLPSIHGTYDWQQDVGFDHEAGRPLTAAQALRQYEALHMFDYKGFFEEEKQRNDEISKQGQPHERKVTNRPIERKAPAKFQENIPYFMSLTKEYLLNTRHKDGWYSGEWLTQALRLMFEWGKIEGKQGYAQETMAKMYSQAQGNMQSEVDWSNIPTQPIRPEDGEAVPGERSARYQEKTFDADDMVDMGGQKTLQNAQNAQRLKFSRSVEDTKGTRDHKRRKIDINASQRAPSPAESFVTAVTRTHPDSASQHPTQGLVTSGNGAYRQQPPTGPRNHGFAIATPHQSRPARVDPRQNRNSSQLSTSARSPSMDSQFALSREDGRGLVGRGDGRGGGGHGGGSYGGGHGRY